MALFSDLIQQAMGGFPTKPNVPAAPNVNAQQAQTQANAGNQAALPGLEDLAGATNQFNTNQFLARREAAAPGITRNISNESDLLNNWLSGILSPDVASAVQRASNAKAFSGGYGGSGMADNLTARDLGLTSLDLQKMGTSAMPGFISGAQAGLPAQFLPQSQFVTTPEQIALNQFNETNRYSRDWLQNQLDSLPDPATAALSKDLGAMAPLDAFMPSQSNPTGVAGGLSPFAGLIGQLFGGGGGGGGAAGLAAGALL